MTDNYLLLIIGATIILYLLYNNSNQKQSNQLKKDKFGDTNNMLISDYIETTSDNLLKEKQELEEKSMSNEFKDLPEYKFGSYTRDLTTKFEKLNDKLDTFGGIINKETKQLGTNVANNIAIINKNDEKFYNTYVRDFYKQYKKKLSIDEDVINNNMVDVHKDIQQTDIQQTDIQQTDIQQTDIQQTDNQLRDNFESTTINNNNIMSTFLGKYFILPYQYKNFNNVYMVLSKYETSTLANEQNAEFLKKHENKYVLGFYLLDELIVEYEVEVFIKDKTLLDLTYNDINNSNKDNVNSDILDNLTGISIVIKDEIPLFKKHQDLVKTDSIEKVKYILTNLGFISNNKMYLFLVESQFEKRYFNMDGGLEGIPTSAYYQETHDDLFRCYSSNGTTLIHLKKKSSINKPFKSLLN